MTSPRLRILERQLLRQTPEQAPAPVEASGLGGAIEQLIDQAVQQRVEAAQHKPPPHVQRLLDQQFNKPEPVYRPLPVKRPPPVFTSTVTRRDAFGRILWLDSVAEDGGPTWRSEVLARDELGSIRSMRTAVLSSDQALPARPYEAAARQYQPGTPRKLYSNDPEG